MSLRERIEAFTPQWIKRTASFCSTVRVRSKLLLSVYIIIIAFLLFDLFIFSFVAWLWYNMPRLEAGLMRQECLNDGFHGVSFTVDNTTLKIVKVYIPPDQKKFSESLDFCHEHNSELWAVGGEEEWEAVTKFISSYYSLDIWLNGKAEGDECPSGAECLRNLTSSGQGLPVRWSTDQKVGTYSRLYRGETTEKKCLKVEDDTLNWTSCYCELEWHYAVCIKRDCFTGL